METSVSSTRAVLGVATSPFLMNTNIRHQLNTTIRHQLNTTIRHQLNKFSTSHSDLVEFLRESNYVDDMLQEQVLRIKAWRSITCQMKYSIKEAPSFGRFTPMSNYFKLRTECANVSSQYPNLPLSLPHIYSRSDSKLLLINIRMGEHLKSCSDVM